MANDFLKNGGFPTLAFNDGASLTCFANDFGYDRVFAHPLGIHAVDGDCLIAISSSGRSPNILAAVTQSCHRHFPSVVTFTGFDEDNPLRWLGAKNYHVPSSDYGVVESAHLAMLHATLRELRDAR